MRLPRPRGPISAGVIHALRSGQPVDSPSDRGLRDAVARMPQPLTDPDGQLALAVCYQLHYTSFEGVADTWEWDPGLLAVRASLEARFIDAVRERVGAPQFLPAERADEALRRLIDADDSPSMSSFLFKHATADHYRAFVAQRSIYQLMEADPHTWAIPRITGQAKASLVEIQADEYGGGNVARMHCALYADLMRGLGLDPAYGAYWDTATAESFAALNLISYFGLHRARRGALLGHLAAFEMTSTAPCRRMANGLRRLGFDDKVCGYYDEHVVADALHEQLAAVDMCGSFVAAEPDCADDVLFGAAACLALEGAVGARLLREWDSGAAGADAA